MKASSLTIGFFLLPVLLSATNYYVSYDMGNDQNNGLSPEAPFKLIQTAADLTLPGDTVFVMNGTYTNYFYTVFAIHRSGTADDWIVYMNYPGHNPLIQVSDWCGIKVIFGASYIEVNGFTIQGNASNIDLEDALNQPGSCNDPNGNPLGFYNGNGIFIQGHNLDSTEYPHHIRIVNNTVYECCGNGIGSMHSDYITIENNLLYNNSWYSIWGNSAISLYQNWNLDSNTTDYRMIIRNNILYGTRNLVPTKEICFITDGNGIIIDDSKHTQNGSTMGAYLGKTLITNNVVYNNGGPGIHVYFSEHVDIVNNTAYHNQQSEELWQGEIDAWDSGDIVIRNNIMNAKADKPINTNTNNLDIVHDHNLYWGGNGFYVSGTNTITDDPLFLAPSTEPGADFQTAEQSPAVDNGSELLAPGEDIIGTPRPIGAGYDIGAYEFDPELGSWHPQPGEEIDFSIYPNPLKTKLQIRCPDLKSGNGIIELFDIGGKKVLEENINKGIENIEIDVSNLASGVYICTLRTDKKSNTKKLIVE